MKKNLQLALAIMLGLATTTVTAQDWSVDSETRMTNMSTDDNETNGTTEQFMRMGVSWGGDNASVHASFNGFADITSGVEGDASFNLHEAYASTDAMGFATLSMGRKAVTLGDGMIVGSNDWRNDGNTFDGVFVDLNNDFADISLGMARFDEADNVADTEGSDNTMWMNVAKDMGNMAFNFTYYNSEAEANGADAGSTTAMGLNGTYALDMGANVSFGYYTSTYSMEGADDADMGLTSLGVSYEVMDGFTAHAGYDMYDEGGFYMATSNVRFDNTGMQMITEEGTNMSFGASYDMGDFAFGVTMNN